MPVSGTPLDVAARVRAALAYANIKLTAKGDKNGVGSISHDTMKRIASPSAQRSATLDELEDIAAACGVPLRFLEVGFAPLETTSSNERLTEIEQRLARVEDALTSLGDDAPAGPRSALARDLADGNSNPQSKRQTPPQGEPDAPPGSAP